MASTSGFRASEVDESDTMQLIRQAVLFENQELLSDLISEHPWSLRVLDRHLRTLLMLAAHNGRTKSIEVLLQLDRDGVHVTNTLGKSALHLCCEAGHVESARALLKAGADPAAPDDSGLCALEQAHIAGNGEVAALLIEAIQHENERINEAHTELIRACIEGSFDDVDKILERITDKNREVILNGRHPEDDTALLIACTNGQESVVKSLLRIESGHVLVNPANKDTVLHAAISSKNSKVLSLVLENYPALIANSNGEGCSCLHWAARSGDLEIVRILLEFSYPAAFIKEIDLVSSAPYLHAVDVNSGDLECRTALYLAVAGGHLNVVQYMLQYQCDFVDGTRRCPFQIDVYCTKGRTPLMVASFNQSLPIITELIDKGADVNLPLGVLDTEVNGDEARCVGSGALVEATRAEALHVIYLLMDRGAVDTDNRALSLAATSNNEKLIRVYLTRLVFPDPEFRVNKKNVDVGQIQVGQNLLPSALCPSRAAMLNWSSANLENVQADWFIAAALQVNPRLRTTRLSLAAITRVDLSGNRLRFLPSVLLQMPSLKTLNLSKNKIVTIDMPSYYVSSTSIETLYLQGNLLESLSSQLLAALPSLCTLDVSGNRLSQLPEYIWLCPALKELNASENYLCSLPVVGGSGRGRGHPKLQANMVIPNEPPQAPPLDLSLDDPPNVITKPLMRQNVWQTEINLSKVDEDELFPEFPVASSNTLTTLNLSSNKFQFFPLCLACTCPRLANLNLANNQLTVLPPVASVPAQLKSLDVSNNNLKEGFQISPLRGLGCHAVPASGIVRRTSPQRQHRSRSKSAVRSQRALSVSRHHPTDGDADDACVHRRHDCLQRLKTLNLSNNRLIAINVVYRDKILFPSLTVLDASENHIRIVPAELSRMISLSVLNMSGNKNIKDLPPELGQLSRLWSLSLKGCQLKEPIASMVNAEKSKTVDLVAYLKTILEESKTYHHLRLVILGGDRVGKTMIWDGLKSEAVHKKSPVQSETVRTADWKYEAKRAKGDPILGPIGVTAWDFCGQREYYATHQYFVTKRALYLVVFRVSDGDAAFADIQRWLVSIEARAPNSLVILVGTHLDHVAAHPNRYAPGYIEEVENKVRAKFLLSDSEKRGMPKVADMMFISAKSKQDIRVLLTSIYKASWEVRIGKERALEQQIPSSYIALAKIVRDMATESRKEGKAAVMSAEKFRRRTEKIMTTKFGRAFRDDVEFYGACSFLHDSGEIVRFADASLHDLIFTDPLWLADFLASCVSLRSTPMCSGLLLQDALAQVTTKAPSKLRNSLLDLLHKHELALTCYSRLLLLPSLLPDEYQLRADYTVSSVKVAVKMSGWSVRSLHSGYKHPPLRALPSVGRRSIESTMSEVGGMYSEVQLKYSSNLEHQLRRLYVLAYVPAGFWGRLITRIVGDQNVSKAVETLFCTNTSNSATVLKSMADSRIKAEWLLWQTGLEMHVEGHPLFVLKQFCPQAEVRDVDYSTHTVQVHDEQKRWKPFPINDWVVVELLLPTLSISCAVDGEHLSMEVDVEGASRLISLIVDLLDTLLEDWYPSLGTRFVHSSEGELLVNRLVPCSHCAMEARQERRTHDDADLGKRESSHAVRGSRTTGDMKAVGMVNCFTIEECMLAGREYGWLECPAHGGVHMKHLAPDTVFADIDGSLLVPADNIRKGRMLGRGAFGFVFRATVKVMTGELSEVAQKMLEPQHPGNGGRPSAVTAYKAAADKWRRDPLEFSCRAYITSRQELNLLSRMRHPNVISLIGVCTSPLSLIVELAPLGALNQLLASHKKSGSRLSMSVIKDSALQVARALEYLHSAHIIYRDMKSENVLGWRFPAPFSCQTDVLLKLGDYGISRSVMPSGGAKGFGGTEGFMAPEMVRFNGEEEYTQKVDIFSFGMFLYELITLKQPFEGEEHVRERLLDGARPILLPHELLIPCNMLDLLVQCWQTQPDARPSSSQVVGFCGAPEFCHVLDVCELGGDSPPTQIVAISTSDDLDDPEDLEAQLWFAGRTEVDVLSCTQYAMVEHKAIPLDGRCSYVSKVRDVVWCCADDGDVVSFYPSLHEVGHLHLPSLSTALVCAPQMLSNELLLLVSQKELLLLALSETNAVSLRASIHSPYAITTAAFVTSGSTRQIWTGHAEGRITAHHLTVEDTFSFSSSLYLPDAESVVSQLVANRDGTHVWIAADNSSRICCVDVEKRQVTSQLDVRKVMPGSETILTLDDEDVATAPRITCMALLEKAEGAQLYIGTSKGMLVVAQAVQLQPISACRPYAGELTSMCIVEGGREEDNAVRDRTTTLSSTSSESGFSWVRDRVNETVERFRSTSATSPLRPRTLLATVGKSFRSLSHRFVNETELSLSHSCIIWTTDDWC